MIEEQASVVALEGDFAWVEAARATTCGQCSARGGCGTSMLAGVLGRRRARLKALNRAGARPGDQVVIGLPEGELMQGTLALYLLPLAGLFAGGLAGETLAALPALAGTEVPTVAGAALGFWAGLFWARARTRRSLPRPVVLRRA